MPAESHSFQPGAVIRERHKHAESRVITSAVHGQYVLCRNQATGRQTRVSWASLRRYDLITPDAESLEDTNA